MALAAGACFLFRYGGKRLAVFPKQTLAILAGLKYIIFIE